MKTMTKQVLRKFKGIIRCRNPECQQIIEEGDLYEVVRSAGQFRYYCADCANEEILVFQANRISKNHHYRPFRRFNKVHRRMPPWFFNWRISEWIIKQLEPKK